MPFDLPQLTTTQGSGPCIGPVDEAILVAVNRYHLATAEQLCRLLYSENSLRYARLRASRLAAAGYLLRTRFGPGPHVFSLGPKGRRYLRSLRLPVPSRLRKDVVVQYGYGHYKHALGVTDILIAADRLARSHSQIQVHALLNEHALKRNGIRVALPNGMKATVCPDAWLDFRLRSDLVYQACLAVEFDRGTEHQPAWRKKIQALLVWAKGPYRAAYGTDSLTIAVLVDDPHGTEQRVRTLVRWTEAELSARGARADAALFCFTPCVSSAIEPARLFLQPVCAVPFAITLTSLLTLSQGGV